MLKEVILQRQHLAALLGWLARDTKHHLVAGYVLRDNVLSAAELRAVSHISSSDLGIAYVVPWNTYAMINYKLFKK